MSKIHSRLAWGFGFSQTILSTILMNVGGTAIQFGLILALVLIAIVVIKMFITQEPLTIKINEVTVMFFIFIGYCGISMIFPFFRNDSEAIGYSLNSYVLLISGVMVYLAVLLNHKYVSFMMKGFVAGVILNSFLIYYQIVAHMTGIYYPSFIHNDNPAYQVQVSPDYLLMGFGFTREPSHVVPLLVAGLFSTLYIYGKSQKGILYVTLIVLALSLTFTSTAMIVLGFIGIPWMYKVRSKVRIKTTFVLFISLIVSVLIIYLIIGERLFSLLEGISFNSQGNEERKATLLASLNGFFQSPFFGFGYGTGPYSLQYFGISKPMLYSLFLSQLLELGVIGVGIFSYFLYRVTNIFGRVNMIGIGILFVVVILALTNNMIPYYFLFLCGISSIISKKKEEKPEKQMKSA